MKSKLANGKYIYSKPICKYCAVNDFDKCLECNKESKNYGMFPNYEAKCCGNCKHYNFDFGSTDKELCTIDEEHVAEYCYGRKSKPTDYCSGGGEPKEAKCINENTKQTKTD